MNQTHKKKKIAFQQRKILTTNQILEENKENQDPCMVNLTKQDKIIKGMQPYYYFVF